MAIIGHIELKTSGIQGSETPRGTQLFRVFGGLRLQLYREYGPILACDSGPTALYI